MLQEVLNIIAQIITILVGLHILLNINSVKKIGSQLFNSKEFLYAWRGVILITTQNARAQPFQLAVGVLRLCADSGNPLPEQDIDQRGLADIRSVDLHHVPSAMLICNITHLCSLT